MIAVGLLVAAVCPGALYGPRFTAMAKGNVALAWGRLTPAAIASLKMTAG
jgi:predicted Na+-dependent transporter